MFEYRCDSACVVRMCMGQKNSRDFLTRKKFPKSLYDLVAHVISSAWIKNIKTFRGVDYANVVAAAAKDSDVFCKLNVFFFCDGHFPSCCLCSGFSELKKTAILIFRMTVSII